MRLKSGLRGRLKCESKGRLKCESKGRLKRVQITPKAFANFSPGLERSDNPGEPSIRSLSTLKALASCLRRLANTFGVGLLRLLIPRVEATLG